MIRAHRAAALLPFVLLFALPPAQAAAQERPGIPLDATDEAFFSIRYETLVNTVVTGRYFQDSLYLPLGAVFSALRIHYVLDPQQRRVTGFFSDPRDPYVLDFPAGVALRGERQIPLPDSAYIPSDVEIYVLPSVLSRAFGISATVDLRDLAVRLSHPQPLPVAEAALREQRRAQIESAELIRPDAPLEYERERHQFGGGVLQYALSASRFGTQTEYSAELAAGAEVAGGDIEGRMLTSSLDRGFEMLDSDLRWRYVYGEDRERWIQQLGVGSFLSDGIRTYDFNGLTVSNEPVRLRDRLGSHLVTGTTHPGWDVELYIGGQLIGYTRADPDGHYAFTMPLVYGTSLVTLRFYGPAGEVLVEERRVEVPFHFVPADRIDYRVDAGRTARERYGLLNARAAWGLRDWLTVRGALEYVGAPGEARPRTVLGAAARLPGNVVVDVETAPGVFLGVEAQAARGASASYALSYTYVPRASFFFPSDLRHQLRLRSFAPMRVGPVPATLRVLGDAQWFHGGLASYNLEAASILSLPRFKPSIGYRRVGIIANGSDLVSVQELTAGLLYQLYGPPRHLTFLRGALITAGAGYNLPTRSLGRAHVDVSRNLSTRGRLSVGVDFDPLTDDLRFEVRYFFDGPALRSSVAVQQRGSETLLSSFARGAVAWDADADRPIPSGREWLGQAGAAIRLFVDRDSDAAYDPGEPVLSPSAIRFRRSVATTVGEDSVLRTTDLLAYNRYSIDIDAAEIRNPLWVPRFGSFSFIADPNGYKRIDVPFYTAGEIEGAVVRVGPGGERGVAGLRVHLRPLDGGEPITVPTFSDGTFYHMGLPPGEYEAAIEPAQLEILRVEAEPAVRRFEIRPTAEGDLITGLDFRLLPRGND